jgi:hypothetical protein
LPEPDPENRAAISIRSARPPIITVTGGWGAPTPTLKIVVGPALARGHLTRKYPIDAAAFPLSARKPAKTCRPPLDRRGPVEAERLHPADRQLVIDELRNRRPCPIS